MNSGSVEKDILAKYGGPTPQGMVESALAHAKMLENCGFYDMVLSMKAVSYTHLDVYKRQAAQRWLLRTD